MTSPPPPRVPAASYRDGSYDIPGSRDPPELSACDTTEIDPHRWPAFDPSQDPIVGRSVTVKVRDFGSDFEVPEK
jgi:hypothetical protein